MRKTRRGMQWAFLALVIWILFLGLRAVSYQKHAAESPKHEDVPLVQDRRRLGQGSIQGLLLYQSQNPNSLEAYQEIEQLLADFRKPVRTLDLHYDFLPNDLSSYRSIYFLGENLLQSEALQAPLRDWVEQGGHLYIGMPQAREEGSSFQSWLGVIEAKEENQLVQSLSVEDNLMIGGSGPFKLSHPFDSAWQVSLDSDCQVPLWETESQTPVLWQKDVGRGRLVVMNLGIYDKVYRGFYSLALSLMEPVYLYPVIASSVIYLDDFPAPLEQVEPVTLGEGRQQDFATFFKLEWWPAMKQLAKDFDLVYTGGVIVSYDNQVTGPFPLSLPDLSLVEMGRELLAQGGELAYHGYNHQPLQLKKEQELILGNYQAWSQERAIRDSLVTLDKLIRTYYSERSSTIYVPPSNILSKQGRRILGKAFPHLKGIASTYFPGEGAYDQEFDLGSDGILNLPRIVAGMDWDDFDQLAVFSELNTHYVFSQFLHPDDLLDSNRNHDQTWESMLERYRTSLASLTQAAPDLPFDSASRFANKVGRFLNFSMKVENGKNFLELDLRDEKENLSFFLRQNQGKHLQIKGGSCRLLTKNLYLIEAKQEKVRIQWEDE